MVMPIAYVTLDSLMSQYNYAKDVNDKLMASAETKQANLNAQGRQLEKEMQDFQYKMNNNAFFSQERAEREYQRLGKKQQDFQQLQQKLSGELLLELLEVLLLLPKSLILTLGTLLAEESIVIHLILEVLHLLLQLSSLSIEISLLRLSGCHKLVIDILSVVVLAHQAVQSDVSDRHNHR